MNYSLKYFIFITFCLLSCGILPEDDSASSKSCLDLIADESWDEAITCFEDGAYDEIPSEDLDPNDHIYLTQWAGAYASKYGLSGQVIVDSFFETDGDEGDSQTFDFASEAQEISQLGDIDTAVENMVKCLTLIKNIPEKYRNPDSDEAVYFANDITFMGGLYTLFLVELQKEQFLTSLNDGELSEAELIALAEGVLSTLEDGGDIVSNPELQTLIDSQMDSLESQPGDNLAEQLEALIGS